jgi:hypothetical protein
MELAIQYDYRKSYIRFYGDLVPARALSLPA